MVKEYYALATGKKGATLGLHYDAYGITIYNNETSAKEKLEELCKKNKLEGKVINLTCLVQKGFISKKNFRFQY